MDATSATAGAWTRLLGTTALCGLLASHDAAAQPAPGTLPAGGQVTAGQATLATAGNQLTVTQASQRAAINWQSYSIGSAAGVTYVQPNAQAIALNRVIGNDPSRIFGSLRANGQVWLINPNGILFGRSARIDVAGLVAATSNITMSDQEFVADTSARVAFGRPGRPDAAIVNRGEITVRDAGLAAFVAPAVVNQGTISARLGRVSLASANVFTLDLYGDQLVNLAVEDRVLGNARDARGRPVAAGVENSGRIMADGGRIELRAQVARNVVDNVIRMSGEVRAASVTRSGVITLHGGDGTVDVTGRIDVSGRAAGARGGTVRIVGERVRIAPTVTIDASGDVGGGTILIGGDWQGRGPGPNARSVAVERGAVLLADATGRGAGGTVVVWSDGTTEFNATVSARGAGGGAGGAVETSGLERLWIGEQATVTMGTGTWLIDPRNIVIDANSAPSFNATAGNQNVTVGWSILAPALAGGGTLSITTRDAGTSVGAGTITVAASASLNASGTLQLLAHSDVVINPGVVIENVGTGGIKLAAGWDGVRTNNLVQITDISGVANITLGAGSALRFGGPITLLSRGIVTAPAASLRAPNVQLNLGAGSSIQGALDAIDQSIASAASVSVDIGNYVENVVVGGLNAGSSLLLQEQFFTNAPRDVVDPTRQAVIAAADPALPAVRIGSSNVTLRTVTFTGSDDAGVRIDGDEAGRNSVFIENANIRGNGAGVIAAGAGTFATIRVQGNFIVNNPTPGGTPGIDSGRGVVFRGNTQATFVDQNRITAPLREGILYVGADASTTFGHQRVNISVNRITDPGRAGIALGGDLGNVLITTNTVWNAFAGADAASVGRQGAIDIRDATLGFVDPGGPVQPAFATGLFGHGTGPTEAHAGLSVFFNDLGGAGYGVAIERMTLMPSTLDVGTAIVINNNFLAPDARANVPGNALGGLLVNDVRPQVPLAPGASAPILAAGNFWGAATADSGPTFVGVPSSGASIQVGAAFDVIVSAWRPDITLNGVTITFGNKIPAGYIPSNTVRVDDVDRVTAGVAHGPGREDPLGRISRGVLLSRDHDFIFFPTISPPAVVDVLPGTYRNEGGTPFGAVVLDRTGLTVQASVYRDTPPPLAFNPDDVLRDTGAPTRLGESEAVLFGGFRIADNCVVIVGFTEPANGIAVRGMTIVGGAVTPGERNEAGAGATGYMAGIVVVSGQNHVFANNILHGTLRQGDPQTAAFADAAARTAAPPGPCAFEPCSAPSPGPHRGIYIATRESPLGAGVPVGTGNGTQILQNDIVGWSTVGVMLHGQGTSIGAVSPVGVEIRRNAFVGPGAVGVQLENRVDAIIANNWFRDTAYGVVIEAPAPGFGPTQITENHFQSSVANAQAFASGNSTNAVFALNWMDAGLGVDTQGTLTTLSVAPVPFDALSLTPGFQSGQAPPAPPPPPPGALPPGVAPPPPLAFELLPLLLSATNDPYDERWPVSGPNSFVANLFLVNVSLGGGVLNLAAIAPAAGGDPCIALRGDADAQANAFLATFSYAAPGASVQSCTGATSGAP